MLDSNEEVIVKKKFVDEIKDKAIVRVGDEIITENREIIPSNKVVVDVKTESEQEGENVTRRISLILGIVSISLSLFFVSQNITGYVVSGEEGVGFGLIGGGLFVLALVSFFIYLRTGKKK